jgi:hypothetical protein
MPRVRPDPDRLLHETALAENQTEVSQEEIDTRMVDVISAAPIILPKTEMLLEPVDTMPCLTPDTTGTLNETTRVFWAGDESMETVTVTGAKLVEPADSFATRELSDSQALDSAELMETFRTDDRLRSPKLCPERVTYIAPDIGEFNAMDIGIGLL